VTPAADADLIAQRLQDEHPDAEPLELDAQVLREWIQGAGGDPDDQDLLVEVVTSWEALLPG
jgi:Fe-S-cluster formation regulator IscX/YfhJ